MSKALQVPLDTKIKELPDIPYTISFVIKKRQQIDNLNELPKDKRPTDEIIWDGTPEELDDWLDKVFDKKPKDGTIEIDLDDVEG